MKIFQKTAIFSQLLLGIFVLILSSTASADPTTNVARLSNISGTVTYSPSGVDKWAYAKLNRPMISGDRLWVDANARAELQLGSAAVSLWSNTYLSILTFNNQTTQFQLNQGSINLHIQKMKTSQVYEIDTPNLAFMIIEPGDYRLDVDAKGTATTISIRRGQGTVYDNKNASYPLSEKKSYVFSGTDLRQHKTFPLAVSDDFDKWCLSRDGYAHKKSITSKYVSSGAIGSDDLDAYGSWQSNASYGHVWVPNNVPPGWAPYSNGSWVWVNQYGWTWVDNAPWGFTPYHYGRWVYFNGVWCWVPGPVYQPPVYAPALVVFFFGGGFLGIGWFPLGPNDVYIPSYPYSSNYFNQINISNTYINNTIINNYYNNPNQVINYSNMHAPNAVTAMPINSFVNSNPVVKGLVVLPKDIAKIPVKPIAPLAPTMDSVIGTTKPVNIKPSPQVLDRPTVARITPPKIVPFDVMQPSEVIKPQPQNIQPPQQAITKPEVPANGVPHPAEVIRPKPQNIQPNVQAQQLQQLQQQRIQEQRMQQQRIQEQQQRRMQELQQQRMQQIQKQRAQEQQLRQLQQQQLQQPMQQMQPSAPQPVQPQPQTVQPLPQPVQPAPQPIQPQPQPVQPAPTPQQSIQPAQPQPIKPQQMEGLKHD